MKPVFTIKRVAPRVTAIFANGFVDDKGDKKATIVLSVITGSHPREARRAHQKLCDALNKAFSDHLGGLL